MQAVLSAIARGRAAIDAHPLYAWMADPGVPLGRRFVFAPLFANFILGFSDLNRWFLRYPEPRDGYEAAINAHTEEDETHSALFLEDWRELGFDAELGWGVEDTMAWYYTAPETEVFRRYAMRLTRMCVETPDPLVRFGLMEAIETCGHVFFGHTAPLAEELSRRTGAALRYFGPYHLARETGTLIDADDLFESVVLTPEQRRRAVALVEEVFAMFTVKNDHLLAYAQAATSGAAVPRPAQAARPRSRSAGRCGRCTPSSRAQPVRWASGSPSGRRRWPRTRSWRGCPRPPPTRSRGCGRSCRCGSRTSWATPTS